MATVASGLAGRGHRVEVVTFSTEAANHPCREGCWTLTILPGDGVGRAAALWRFLRSRRPAAILLADHRFAAAATLVARSACPRAVVAPVLHCDPEGVLRSAGHMTPVRLGLWRALLMISVARAPKVIAVSNGVRERASAWLKISAARMVTIYNPVLSSRRSPVSELPTGVPWLDVPERPVVLGVGRLSHEKDWATVLAAFALLRRQIAARLIIVGDGPDRGRIEEEIARLGLDDDVLLPGEVDDAAPFMTRAHVLAHSAVTEGLGNVLVEALALGLPVVAADCPVGPGEVLENGRWGTLVPVGDPGAMAAALVVAIRRGRAPSDAAAAMWTRFGADRAIELYERTLSSWHVGRRPPPLAARDGGASLGPPPPDGALPMRSGVDPTFSGDADGEPMLSASVLASARAWCRWALVDLAPAGPFLHPVHRSAHVASRVVLRSLRPSRTIRAVRPVFEESEASEGAPEVRGGRWVVLSRRPFTDAVRASGSVPPLEAEVRCHVLRDVAQSHKTSRVYRLSWRTAGRSASLILKRILAGPQAPRTEVAVYQSGLLARLPAALSVPRCFAASTGEAGYDLWLEDLAPSTRPIRRRSDDLRAAGAALGHWNGQRWARPEFASANITLSRAAQWATVCPWQDGLASGSSLRRRFERVAADVDRLLGTFANLDMVFSHQDASPLNLRLAGGPRPRLAVLDWELCGPAPLGQELAPLVWARWWEARCDEIRGAEACAWRGYLDGLRTTGAPLLAEDIEAMRFAYSACVFVRYGAHVAGIGDRATLELVITHGETAMALIRG